MTLEQKKSEIISAIEEELARIHIQLGEGELRTNLNGNTWAVWVEQKGGLDSRGDKFLVDLDELNLGVNYIVAVGYRVRRWASFLDVGARGFGRIVAQTHMMPTILMAEDDKDDCFFITKALEMNQVKNPFVTVSDGEQLLDYLYRRGNFAGPNLAPTPAFILLDLNMPRMDGREALKIIKNDERLRKIPIVILTTSRSEEDILNGYDSGVNSYITKPSSFDGFVKIVQTLQNYWLHVVELPNNLGPQTQIA